MFDYNCFKNGVNIILINIIFLESIVVQNNGIKYFDVNFVSILRTFPRVEIIVCTHIHARTIVLHEIHVSRVNQRATRG